MNITHRYLANVTTLTYADEKCIGCGRCADVCPHGVFDVADGKAQITDRDLCMECGACALNCPAGAIGVNAGAGCAAAIIYSWITGKEPTCGCDVDLDDGDCNSETDSDAGNCGYTLKSSGCDNTSKSSGCCNNAKSSGRGNRKKSAGCC
jgi:NAD-dependent dihydropyrimidine dehydrogenase PreA subunit